MKYHFHARASGIPLFISESIFHPEGYGMFDYYFLQEKTLLSGYFSDFGIQQMRDYARMNLFDPARRRDIIKAIRAYDERLQNFTLPENYWSTHLDMRNRLAKFATMKALAKEFGSQYFIMEQPWLFPLEEIVQRACDREGLTLEVVLRDSKIIRNFSKEEETLLKTLVELGHLKLSVHAHVEPLMQATHQLFTFISRKEGIPMEIVQSMVSDDIEEYFRTGIVALDELELRSQGVVLLPSGIDGAPKMGVGVEYEKWRSNLEARFDGDIKGVVACRGKVRGRVTLHLDWINVTEVPKGNILVTGMTNPQMIPYIKNVAGIVTDEGGLMCHAAIISREMKKPCIIGTKIATQVLHDGDLVEVDACPSSGVADNGVVRILEKLSSGDGEKIMKVDWEKLITREMDLFLFSSAFEANSRLMKEAFGFGYEKILVNYDGTKGTLFHSTKELQESKKYFRNLFDNEDGRLAKWLKEEQELQRLEIPEDPMGLIEYFQKVLLFNTLLPTRALFAIEGEGMFEHLIPVYEEMRNRGTYPLLYKEKISPLLKRITKENGLPGELSGYLTLEELRCLLKGKNSVIESVLRSRKNGCALYLLDGKIRILHSELKIASQPEGVEVRIDQISGKSAFHGVTQGKVRIVNTIDQMKYFQNGEVLVSISTNPSLIFAIKKACAIVTDEGGIISHAAIVAREMKKPCIIGTKIATQVLHDGDLVEVDADRGIVTILERGPEHS